MWQVYAEEADEQRQRAVRAEMELTTARDLMAAYVAHRGGGLPPVWKAALCRAAGDAYPVDLSTASRILTWWEQRLAAERAESESGEPTG